MAEPNFNQKEGIPRREQEAAAESDAEVFYSAMSDVTPLQSKKTAPRVNGYRTHLNRSSESELEDSIMSDFMEGKIEFDWHFHPGYQEGGPERTNRPLIRKLRKGHFSVQAELDLHGMTQAEAILALDAFLDQSLKRSLRCVRIIHGKGKNSANQIGILKHSVPRWLSTNRNARRILAFTSASVRDGGIGATYVLLRRQPTKRAELG